MGNVVEACFGKKGNSATAAASVESLIDIDLLRRYDVAGPRYTSYPTANCFHEEFTADDYRAACARSNASRRPLSLYLHIPFCATVCYYCACNRIVTGDRSRSRDYLDLLKEEIRMQSDLFDRARPVEQLHWGGGTPTFLSAAEMTELMYHTARHFHLLDGDRGEYSIEVDPRTVDEAGVGLLRGLGFNRLSLGVQDFDPAVQKAVNRVQSFDQVRTVVEAARGYAFRSISFDLIYGLPRQSAESFARTLEQVVALAPDRLSVFNYAHLPTRFKTQRQIDELELPSAAEKLRILDGTIRRLLDAGYVHIGMDHFARPDDELAVALRNGRLQRNFQGYSIGRGTDLVGLGLSSIGQVDNTYAQNAKAMSQWEDALRAGRLPLERGMQVSAEDEVRRQVIMDLACRGEADLAAAARTLGEGAQFFAGELARLEQARADGLVESDGSLLRITPRGRLLVRNICMVFDRHLGDTARPGTFSRVI